MFQTTNQIAITGTSTKYGPSLSSLFFPVGVAKIATTVINVGWTIVKHVLLILMSATMTVITMITPITTTISVKVYQLCIYRNNRAICSYSAPINIYQHLIHQHLPQNYHIVWYTIVAVFIGFYPPVIKDGNGQFPVALNLNLVRDDFPSWTPPLIIIYSPGVSMYGIYANIGGILMVNVTIYSIHGSYG